MTDLAVAKVVAYMAAGPAPADLSVSKVVAYAIINTNVVETPAAVPDKRRRVQVNSRAAYSPGD